MPMKAFLGLKANMYAFVTEDNKKHKKVINKNVVHDKLKYEDH